MYTIKMLDDKSLSTTIKATIYQYEKNADTIVFLLPMTYEEKSIADCTVLLRYILPNEIGKSEELEMLPEPYKNYYKYRLKVTSTLTDIAGKIELWLSIIDTHDDLVLKTGSVVIEVQASKDISKYLSSGDRNQLDRLNEKVARLEQLKADSIMYNGEGEYLQLTANGTPIGDRVDMSGISSGDTANDPNNPPDDSGNGENSGDGSDDVIYF